MEGIEILLCSEWTGNCKGTTYTATTDALGMYRISDVEPGVYTLAHRDPAQQGTFLPGGEREIQVFAGQTLNQAVNVECKYDLGVSSVEVNNGQITMNWDWPQGYIGFDAYAGSVYWDGDRSYSIQGTIWTSRTFSHGNYMWFIYAMPSRGGYLCAMGWWSVP